VIELEESFVRNIAPLKIDSSSDHSMNRAMEVGISSLSVQLRESLEGHQQGF